MKTEIQLEKKWREKKKRGEREKETSADTEKKGRREEKREGGREARGAHFTSLHFLFLVGGWLAGGAR